MRMVGPSILPFGLFNDPFDLPGDIVMRARFVGFITTGESNTIIARSMVIPPIRLHDIRMKRPIPSV